MREARNALIDRVVLAPLIRITLAPKEYDSVIAEVADRFDRSISIVLRHEYQPFRPLFTPCGGVIVRFDEDLKLTRPLLRRIIAEVQKLRNGELRPIGGADNRIYFLRDAHILGLLDILGIAGRAAEPEIQGRLGTLLKRPGGDARSSISPGWSASGVPTSMVPLQSRG